MSIQVQWKKGRFKRILFSNTTLFLLFLSISTLPAQQKTKSVYISMGEAISRALSQNNQVRSSQFAVKRAIWNQKNAWTQLLPSLSLSSTYTRIDDRTFAERDFRRYLPPELANQIPQTVFQTSYYTSLDVTVPLFNGALLNNISIANANKNIAVHMSKSTRESIIFQVISNYLNVLQSKEILKLEQDYLDLSRLNYEKATRLYNAGRYSMTEALRWKVDFQQQKSKVTGMESILRNNMALLNRLLSRDMHEPIDIENKIPDKLLQESKRVQQLSDKDILDLILVDDATLIRINAALAAAFSNKETSRLLYRNSYTDFMPTVSASYSYGWRENNTIYLDDYSPTTFMIHFRFPLFKSFQNYTTLKSSYYAFRESQEEFYDQLQDTRLFLTEISNKIIELKTQLELSEANVEYNEHNYRVVNQQKEKGLVSNIDFIDAKLNLQDAKLTHISNHYSFISAMVELYYLLGNIENIIEY